MLILHFVHFFRKQSSSSKESLNKSCREMVANAEARDKIREQKSRHLCICAFGRLAAASSIARAARKSNQPEVAKSAKDSLREVGVINQKLGENGALMHFCGQWVDSSALRLSTLDATAKTKGLA